MKDYWVHKRDTGCRDKPHKHSKLNDFSYPWMSAMTKDSSLSISLGLPSTMSSLCGSWSTKQKFWELQICGEMFTKIKGTIVCQSISITSEISTYPGYEFSCNYRISLS